MKSSSAFTRGTKRRRDGPYTLSSSNQALSRRVTRLSKSLKASNPIHVETLSLAAVQFNTTGVLTECLSTVSQGDNYNQRFGNKCHFKRIVAQFYVKPGSTQAAAACARIVIFRAGSGAALPQFASNVSSSPVIGNGVTQVFYDRLVPIGSTTAALGFGGMFRINCKVKSPYKFSGTGAGTQTGESVYIYFIGDAVAGTACPVSHGWIDNFFSP